MPFNYRVISWFVLALLASLLAGLSTACSAPTTPGGPPPSTPSPTAATATQARQLVATPAANPSSTIQTPAFQTPTPTPAPSRITPDISHTAAPAPPRAPATPATEAFAPAPERDLFRLAAELSLPADFPEIDRVVNPEPVSYAAGRRDDFWLVDMRELKIYQSPFELRLVSPHAYWYVEKGQQVEQSDLERSAAEFEDVIYPQVTGYFGQEWTPGVDNDPHLNIVHGDIRGAAGYFSSTDEYPVSVRPHSNQREMIYINSNYLRVGSGSYLEVLAHELQHAIHWNYDTSEDSWISEGLAELAVTVAGYPAGSTQRFMRSPFVSLVHWPIDDANISAHYGGASLFMHYLAEHYSGNQGSGGRGDLRLLLTEPGDNITGMDAYLAAAGYDKTFDAVFQDWVAANFLDESQGIYGYADLQVLVQESRVLHEFAELDREVAQYGTHYIEITPKLHGQPLRFRFEGVAENRLLPTEVSETGCWWSNSGDSITSSLTRTVDLTSRSQATLAYAVWYGIEEEWDYVYLQVSEDGGRRWQILETPHTSAANPVGTAFGPGYTGKSGEWLTERIDLSAYAGKEIQVRFQYVTDDALNDIGLCLREIAVPEAGISAGDMGWQPVGFIQTDNRVRQDYIVQIIQKGEENRVTALPLTADGYGALQGEVVVTPYPGLKRTMVAVSATAPRTREKAPYKLTISATSP